jgi:hypothetical protein
MGPDLHAQLEVHRDDRFLHARDHVGQVDRVRSADARRTLERPQVGQRRLGLAQIRGDGLDLGVERQAGERGGDALFSVVDRRLRPRQLLAPVLIGEHDEEAPNVALHLVGNVGDVAGPGGAALRVGQVEVELLRRAAQRRLEAWQVAFVERCAEDLAQAQPHQRRRVAEPPGTLEARELAALLLVEVRHHLGQVVDDSSNRRVVQSSPVRGHV